MPGCWRRGSRAPRGCASFLSSLLRDPRRDRGVRRRLADLGSERAHAARGGEQQPGRGLRAGASMYSVSDKFRVRVYRARHRAFRAVPARLGARARDRRRDFPLCRRQNTIGIWSSPFPPARSRRCASAGRAARLDELDGAELVEDRRDDPHGRAFSCRQPLGAAAPRRSRELGGGRTWARTSASKSVAGKLNRVGYEAFHARACGRPRAPATATSSSATGCSHLLQKDTHRPRADRGSLQAQPRQAARRRDRRRQRLPQERDRDAGHLQPGRRRARPRLALRDAAVRRDADPHRPSAGGDAEVAGAAARAGRRLAGIRQDSRSTRSPSATARSGRDRTRAICARWTARASPRRAPEGTTAAPGAKGTTALDRFSQDLTAKAKAGDDGPDPRPRRRNPPDHRRADAPAAEQPDPHRRGGRRQDRGRRGLRPAHRLGRRAAAAARRQALRARRRPDAGGRLDEGRVRAAAALGDRRGAILADADHPVHRRGAHADRRGRRGGHGRRGESAEAGARARNAAHHRGDDLVRIPAVFREGPGAHPALPADPHRRARRRDRRGHAARPRRRRWRSTTRCGSPTRRSSRR